MTSQGTNITIIGAGIGGLICALELCKHGYEVNVFEKSNKPGGYAHSFKRKEYNFDVSLHHIGGLEEGGMTWNILQPFGVLDKIEFIRRNTLFKARFPDRTVVLPNTENSIIDYLSEMFPEEKMNISKLFSYLKQLKEHIISPILYSDFDIHPNNLLSANHKEQTFDQLLSLFIQNNKLKTILGQLWMYLGLPPQIATANYSTCIFTSSFLEGSYHIKGGGAALIDVLIQTIEESGGKVHCKSEVKQIVSKNGVVNGVKLYDGTFVESDYVISNADPYQTFFKLIPEDKISKIFKHRLNSMEVSLSIYSMYLGLDCSAESLNIPDGNYFFNHSYDHKGSYNNCVNNNIEETDWCLSNYKSPYNEFSSNDKGVISFAELTHPGNWFSLSKEDYKKEKVRIQEKLLNKYCKVFPGLNKHINVLEFGTPKTMNRYSGNYGGAIYGLAQTIDQSNNKRLGNKAPIKGLFITGSWTQAGGGYEGAMMSGLQTAHAVINQSGNNWGPRRFIQEVKKPILKKDHMKYEYPIYVYPDDTDYTGKVKATAYLRYLDRARVDFGNVSEELVKLKPLLNDTHVNVYQITIDIVKKAELKENLQIVSGYRKSTSHRAAVDQVIYSSKKDICAIAVSEIMYVTKSGELLKLPDIYSSKDTLPLDIKKSKLPRILFSNTGHFTHRSDFEIHYEDTDAQGIVYNVSYAKLCEKAFWDNKEKILPDQDTTFPEVRRIEIRFLNSAVLGDKISVLMGMRTIDKCNFVIDYRIINKNTKDILTDGYMEYVIAK